MTAAEDKAYLRRLLLALLLLTIYNFTFDWVLGRLGTSTLEFFVGAVGGMLSAWIVRKEM